MRVNQLFSKAALCGAVLVGLAGAGLTGCDKPDAGGSGGGSHASSADASKAVAIVDLDRVAKDLGWGTKLEANLSAYRQLLIEDVKKYAAAYDAQVQDKVKSMLPKDMKQDDKVTLTPAQSQELTNLVVAARQQVGQLAQGGDQMFNNYRAAWFRQYREALMPIVRQTAQDKHVTVVFSQTDTVLYTEPTVDLTNAVVDAARAKPPALTDVPMTHMQGAENIAVNAVPPVGTTQPATKATTKP